MKTYIKLLLILLLIGIIAIFSYLYFTRPINTEVSEIPKTEENNNSLNLYVITNESEVEYNIGEYLDNEPVLVKGKTNEIFGEFIFDKENPQNIKINDIVINAKSFKTDQERRDSAVVRFILKSEDPQNEFIKFQTKEIRNLPDSFEIGGSYELEILGDLTISNITKSSMFKTILEVREDEKLYINGETSVNYKDFGLSIPSLPFLSNIDEQVILKLNLVAQKNDN